MDSQTKTGKVYLQPHKAGKKWKPVWLSLFPPSSNGVGRLEIQDMGGGITGGDHMVRRHLQSHVDKKLVRLSEMISVLRLPPNAEACPMENMSAFCVETRDRTLVFAALKEDCIEWVEKLCQSTFQKGVSSNTLEMQENHIYASADEEFWVTVQRTDAATRCDLKGSYWLQVGREALLLREPQKKNIVGEWPYELLRRYGKDKLALTIEAGRRCESGPGTFTFETQQAEKIFSLIQGTIKWKTSSVTSSSQNQDGEKVIAARAQAHSPLPKILDVMGAAGILGTNPKTGGGKSPVLDNAQEDVVGSLGSGSVQPAPITLMPLPQVPTHDSQSPQPEAVYAEPADCIKSVPKATPTMSLYVDPASILPLKPPNSRECGPPAPTSSAPSFTTNHPDPVYSEVYDKISPVPDQQTVFQSKEKCFADDEPIYSEPVSKRDEVSPRNGNKPDPFAHLYAQVCKTTSSLGLSESPNKVASSSSHTASMNATNSTDDPLDDVIYENLGII